MKSLVLIGIIGTALAGCTTDQVGNNVSSEEGTPELISSFRDDKPDSNRLEGGSLIDSIRLNSKEFGKSSFNMEGDKINGQPNLPFISDDLFYQIYNRDKRPHDSVYVYGFRAFNQGIGVVLYNNSAECDHESDWYSYCFIDSANNVSRPIIIAALDVHVMIYEVTSRFDKSIITITESVNSEWAVENPDLEDTLFFTQWKIKIETLNLDTIEVKEWVE